jgi:hypothetical protein
MAPVFLTNLCDILCELPKPHGAKGAICAGKLSTASGAMCRETVAKHDILL